MSLTEKTNNKQEETLGIELSFTEDGDLVVQTSTKMNRQQILKEIRARKNSGKAWGITPDYVNDLADSNDKLEDIEVDNGVDFMEHYTVTSYVDDPITGNRTIVPLEFTDMSVVCGYSLEEKLRYIRHFVESILYKVSFVFGECGKHIIWGSRCTERTVLAATHRSNVFNFRIDIDNKDDCKLCNVKVTFDTDIDKNATVYCQSKGCFCDKYVREAKDRINFTYNLEEMRIEHLFASLHEETLDCLKNKNKSLVYVLV